MCSWLVELGNQIGPVLMLVGMLVLMGLINELEM